MNTKRVSYSSGLEERLKEAKEQIGVSSSSTTVKEWWSCLERLNKDQMHLVLKLATELKKRRITISDFFDVWRFSHLEDVEANLALLDTLIQDR